MKIDDERILLVVAYMPATAASLVGVNGSRPFDAGWYVIEQGGEPVLRSSGGFADPATRFYGPFESRLDALRDAVARYSRPGAKHEKGIGEPGSTGSYSK